MGGRCLGASTADEMVFGLKKDAALAMWKTVQNVGDDTQERASDLWAAVDSYWQGVWWMDRAILERKESAKAILRAEAVSRICATN